MATTEQRHDLYYEYFHLMTVADGGLTPEIEEEAMRFCEAVTEVMGRTDGLGMVMIDQVRRMLEWETIKKTWEE